MADTLNPESLTVGNQAAAAAHYGCGEMSPEWRAACVGRPGCNCAAAGEAAITAYLAAEAEPWQLIETAPQDGTLVWVYVAAAHGLPAFQTVCAYHPDGGWCCDELRSVTHWKPLRSVWHTPPTGAPA